ncbi:two-component system response regulator TctD [Roseateles asaccharophilus]|uniref:response regulator transcription factor n=1 Tax=Roseateles asaccharophilus TaxID=582607 RepID=UPI0038349FD6
MRVLVVEDEPALAESLTEVLASPKANMIPTLAENGVHALAMIEQARRLNRPYDAIILDLTLPGMDGMDVLKSMRKASDMTPVLILTARRTLADKVDGLETGADDYMAKPFEADELLARLRAITRRRGADPEAVLPTCGNLSYDQGKGYFTVGGAVLTLPPKSHAILQALFRRREQPVSLDFLTNMDDAGSSQESVHTQVSRLRKKLQDVGSTAEIKTNHGFGYTLSASANKS